MGSRTFGPALGLVLALLATPAAAAVQVKLVGTVTGVDDYMSSNTEVGTPVALRFRPVRGS